MQQSFPCWQSSLHLPCCGATVSTRPLCFVPVWTVVLARLRFYVSHAIPAYLLPTVLTCLQSGTKTGGPTTAGDTKPCLLASFWYQSSTACSSWSWELTQMSLTVFQHTARAQPPVLLAPTEEWPLQLLVPLLSRSRIMAYQRVP